MIVRRLLQVVSLSAFLILLYDLGYDQSRSNQALLFYGYFATVLFFIAVEVYRILRGNRRERLFNAFRLLLPVFTFLLMTANWLRGESLLASVKQYEYLFFINIVLLLAVELTLYISKLYQKSFSPAVVFVGSFMALIAGGTVLLSLPNATTKGISFIDALFTATSAVSVTGLAVLDTGKDFTLLGQTVILVLIQLGGLGMLTLTSFFAYFFKGNSSYQEDLFIKDFLSSEHLGGLLELSLKIVLYTLAIELAGALIIYAQIPAGIPGLSTFQERTFFSIFHAISAFCNAGFSTLSNSLYEPTFRFNYNLHLVVAVLLIMGGIGYNIMFNVLLYLRVKLGNLYRRYILRSLKYQHTVRVVTLNTKIVLYTTGALILLGWVFFFWAEYHNTLDEHHTLWGKLVTSFFGAVTPRTAGFNTIDMRALSMPSIMITFLLMWIGASPASTGGGIKTSTFALATLNIFSTVTGKHRIELGSREVPQSSLNRAFAIISLSLIAIGSAIFFLAAFEPDLGFREIAFECFSAYSTVGLSLGITGSLSDYSKITLIFTMFLGRVGAINILIGILKQVQHLSYQYPKESVLIN
ncbi:MAG: hypothetical protein H6555_09105 [Lewinellaceae bacterium]|nr:hypothetical protein [Lewinellaceae bacterium]